MLLEIQILVKALKCVEFVLINCEDCTKDILVGIFVDTFDFIINNSLCLGISNELIEERFQFLSGHQLFKIDNNLRNELFLNYFWPYLPNLSYLLFEKQKLSQAKDNPFTISI